MRPAAAPPPCCPAAGPRLPGWLACKPAQGNERGCCGAPGGGGAGCGRPRPAAAHLRVCGPAAASWQDKWTALYLATKSKSSGEGHAPCVELLLKAGADASLADTVSYGAERGLRSEAWGVGARSGAERGSGPAQRRVAFPRRLAPSPQTGCHHTSSLPPRPSQDGKTALDVAKVYCHTEIITLLEKYAAQVKAAPRRDAPFGT